MKKRVVVIIILAVLGLAVIGILATRKPSSKGVTVTVKAAPSASTLTLDGQKISAGRVTLTPGKHTFTASLKYFDTTSTTVDTKTVNTSRTIYLMPAPNSPEAKQWLQDHPEAQTEREQAGDTQASLDTQQLRDTYPIVSKLPYETLEYKIDYAFDNKNNFSLSITLFPTSDPANASQYKQELQIYKGQAMDYLIRNGVDTSKVPITFNPDPDSVE